jgi:hypothetical protein
MRWSQADFEAPQIAVGKSKAEAGQENGFRTIFVYGQWSRRARAGHRFPAPGGRHSVWSPNGRELFYEAEDDRIMVATYTATGGLFAADKPRRWSETQLIDLTSAWSFDLAPDGSVL